MIKAAVTVAGVEIPEFLEENMGPMWEKAAKKALRQEWHKKSYPQRFKAGAAQKFDYAPRNKYYLSQKWQKKKHTRDMVWSGELERQSTRRITMRSGNEAPSAPTGVRTESDTTSQGFVVNFSLKCPIYMTYRPRLRERQELTRMPDWEVRWLNGKISKALDKIVRRETRKVLKNRVVLYDNQKHQGQSIKRRMSSARRAKAWAAATTRHDESLRAGRRMIGNPNSRAGLRPA